jgi:hypothetical protein
LIPNPIHKVLSTFQNCKVRALLMGGQACVFYGAAEFSRDTDFAIHADPPNLERLIYDLLSLPDLVQAKKTQRDKDWPMIRRLIEADRAACTAQPTSAQVRFWLREARTPTLLIEIARAFPDEAREDCSSVSGRSEGIVKGIELEIRGRQEMRIQNRPNSRFTAMGVLD